MINIHIAFEAIDEETCKVIYGDRAQDIAGHTAEIIRDRLVGGGFLDADTTLGEFKITLGLGEVDPFDLISELRNRGYAVAAWTPDEVGDADVDTLEDIMVERGSYYLDGGQVD